MLIETTIKEERRVTKEIKTPYYVQTSRYSMMRLNANGSIMIVHNWGDSADIQTKRKDSVFYKSNLEELLQGEEVDELVFENFAIAAQDLMKQISEEEPEPATV